MIEGAPQVVNAVTNHGAPLWVVGRRVVGPIHMSPSLVLNLTTPFVSSALIPLLDLTIDLLVVELGSFHFDSHAVE